MKSPKELFESLKRGPADVVGVDIGSTATKVVRMHKSDQGAVLTAAEVLPLVEFPPPAEGQGDVPALALPPKLKTRYACLCLSAPRAIVKLLSFPGQSESIADKVVENMGLENPDSYRIGYHMLAEGHGRAEARVLAVAMAEDEAAQAPRIFPAGLPAPFSLEVSGLAAMTTFMHGVGAGLGEKAVGVIEFGGATTTFGLFNRGTLTLIRRFICGTERVIEKVQNSLGVDRQTAQGIITDGSFDISPSVSDVVGPLMKQLVVSRDFVERRENCHVETLYVGGALCRSHDTLNEIRNAMEIDVEEHDPFLAVKVADGAVPDNMKDKGWVFAGAIGACLGTFEET